MSGFSASSKATSVTLTSSSNDWRQYKYITQQFAVITATVSNISLQWYCYITAIKCIFFSINCIFSRTQCIVHTHLWTDRHNAHKPTPILQQKSGKVDDPCINWTANCTSHRNYCNAPVIPHCNKNHSTLIFLHKSKDTMPIRHVYCQQRWPLQRHEQQVRKLSQEVSPVECLTSNPAVRHSTWRGCQCSDAFQLLPAPGALVS